MSGLICLVYGGVSYLVFFGAFLYAVGFVANVAVPKSIDSGPVAPLAVSLAVNVGLLALFALQHSVMARAEFKAWWTKIVPRATERSTYVLFSSLALILLYWQWRPLPMPVWALGGAAADAVWALSAAGWGIVLIATFLLSHFDLFGLAQVYSRFRGVPHEAPGFRTPLLYAVVRHPIYMGFVIAFWATPVMSVGHLLFALATTGYIVIGALLEERDLLARFGQDYADYRNRVPMLLPLPGRSRPER